MAQLINLSVHGVFMWSFQAEVYCVHKTHVGFRVSAMESSPVIQGVHIDVTMGYMG